MHGCSANVTEAHGLLEEALDTRLQERDGLELSLQAGSSFRSVRRTRRYYYFSFEREEQVSSCLRPQHSILQALHPAPRTEKKQHPALSPH